MKNLLWPARLAALAGGQKTGFVEQQEKIQPEDEGDQQTDAERAVIVAAKGWRADRAKADKPGALHPCGTSYAALLFAVDALVVEEDPTP